MSDSGIRIALLEDDAAQAELISSWLKQAGHFCHTYDNGQALLRAIAGESFDLMIFDWELPDVSGIDVVKHVRERAELNIPVLFTTSRDSEADIVLALEAGADDYLTKPIRQAELIARISAIYRRRNAEVAPRKEVEYAPFKFHTGNQTVETPAGVVQLTAKEFELALFLFRNQGRLLSRGHILESVWGQRADLNTRTVDTHASLLRQKLGLRASSGWRLSTVYKHGYRLETLETAATE